jgi:hypothetical protein
MSYDYLMFRSPRGLDPQAAVDEAAFERLGSPDELAKAISQVFPSIAWKASRVNAGVRTGGPDPEFLLNAEADGQVHSFTVSRASTLQAGKLATALTLSAVDMQSGEIARF